MSPSTNHVLSLLRYPDGREERLTEAALKKRLREPLEGESLYFGHFKSHTLVLPDYSKGKIYNLCVANITKLVVGANCSLMIDCRENNHIESLRVGENFNGGINLSHSVVESISIADNCRCDLSIDDSKRCFSLNIADVYSGNLTFKNTCLYSLNIGYYSYASIHLADTWCKRELSIGDSFRGTLRLENTEVDTLKLGKDCKGIITVCGNHENKSCRKVEISNEFAGVLDLSQAHKTEELEVASHAHGKFELAGANSLREAAFGEYFSGYADFSNSAIEYITAAYGCSGEFILRGCQSLNLLQLPCHKSSVLTFGTDPLEVRHDGDNIYYHFTPQGLGALCCPPLYHKIYSGLREMFSIRRG